MSGERQRQLQASTLRARQDALPVTLLSQSVHVLGMLCDGAAAVPDSLALAGGLGASYLLLPIRAICRQTRASQGCGRVPDVNS